MSDWREELIEKMVDALAVACGYRMTTQRKQILDAHARAALAVAEPAIREQVKFEIRVENVFYGISHPEIRQNVVLREENARLREAFGPIVKIKAFTCCYEWTPVEALRDDEEVNVKLTGAQIKKMRAAAAIREGGKE